MHIEMFNSVENTRTFTFSVICSKTKSTEAEIVHFQTISCFGRHVGVHESDTYMAAAYISL